MPHQSATDKFDSVLYQGVRVFVERFLHNDDLINALLVELLLGLEDPVSSRNFFENLLQIILEPAIANFRIVRYAAYIGKRSQSRGHNKHAGPIKTFYERACVHDQGKPSRLLSKLGNQASELIGHEQTKSFLMSLSEELLAIVDASLPESRECIQALVTTYITKNAGIEPAQPTDWARPEEVDRCYRKDCNECSEMETFLRNGETENSQISHST